MGLDKLKNLIKERIKASNDKCFNEHKEKDGNCYGLYGGDRFTDYLSYSCIGCEHLTLTLRKDRDNNGT